MKKRRARRSEPKDWVREISKGNVNAFYKSTDWDIAREKALMRDKHVCQFFIGKWHDDKHRPKQLEVVGRILFITLFRFENVQNCVWI